ncbi:MAG: hypothetical protein ACKO0M_14055, partial [Cyanobium sp.]
MADTFQQAFEQLLHKAPSPLFPKARQLYLRKYCLEGPSAGALRTFLLEEEISEETGGTLLTVRARRFAVVHWQAPALQEQDYLRYLQSRWQLETVCLQRVTDTPWFREGGAWAWFRAEAVYVRVFEP